MVDRQPNLVLYFAPGSSSMAPHIALHEIGAPFEPRPVSFASRELRESAFLAVNPQGKVPVLLADGRPLTEVAAILYWLARRFPATGLWPEGDLDREADGISWMSFIASSLHPARRQGAEKARELYRLADRRLNGRDWALGRYSVVDIHLFRLYWRFRNSLGPFPDDTPGLEAHYARIMQRPAVRQTIAAEAAIGYELPA